MNKPVYLGLSILEISKVVTMSFSILRKTNIPRKGKTVLCGNIKTDDIYKDIAEDVEKRSDTSNYELGR